MRRREHDRGEVLQSLVVFLDQELRVTDNVEEEDLPDLQASKKSSAPSLQSRPDYPVAPDLAESAPPS